MSSRYPWRQALSRLVPTQGKRLVGRSARHRGEPGPVLERLEDRLAPAAVVFTDLDDYAPGSTAIMTATSNELAGMNYQVGETVQFLVERTDGIESFPPSNLPWRVTDGEYGFAPYQDEAGLWWYPDTDGEVNGSFGTTWYVDPQYAGASLRVTATGLTSGAEATHDFTDAVISSTPAGGNWNSPSTWVGGVVPGFGDSATIVAGATVTVNGTFTVSTLIVNNSASGTGTLTFNAGAQLTVTGSVTVGGNSARVGVVDMTNGGLLQIGGNTTPFAFGAGGSFTAGTGTVAYNGANQTITATTPSSPAPPWAPGWATTPSRIRTAPSRSSRPPPASPWSATTSPTTPPHTPPRARPPACSASPSRG